MSCDDNSEVIVSPPGIVGFTGKLRPPLGAIRAYCLTCSGDSAQEVQECQLFDCALFPYRFGRSAKKKAKANDPELEKRLAEYDMSLLNI